MWELAQWGLKSLFLNTEVVLTIFPIAHEVCISASHSES